MDLVGLDLDKDLLCFDRTWYPFCPPPPSLSSSSLEKVEDDDIVPMESLNALEDGLEDVCLD